MDNSAKEENVKPTKIISNKTVDVVMDNVNVKDNTNVIKTEKKQKQKKNNPGK